MVRMLSKRKRPSREVETLKEQLKVAEGTIDDRTIMRLSKLMTKGVISKLDFLIAKGKEADVYVADSGPSVDGDFVVLKVFRVETTNFFNRSDYMAGDERFPALKKNIYWIVNQWCKKEYGNLKLAQEAGVHAPKPYAFNGNVLAMEFIGNDTYAKQLKFEKLQNPEEVLKTIVADVKKLYSVGVVHCDLSEYNILVKDGVPYMIDFGQAVLHHPRSEFFLKRDLDNISSFFNKKYRMSVKSDDLYNFVTAQPQA